MPPGGMGLERRLQSSLSFTDFPEVGFASLEGDEDEQTVEKEIGRQYVMAATREYERESW